MTRRTRLLGILAAAALGAALPLGTPVQAQREPSLRTSCAALRADLTAIAPGDEVAIEVRGTVSAAKAEEGFAALLLCRPPELRVLCVTAGLGEVRAGDAVTVVGTYSEADDGRVLLDPCLVFGAGKTP